MGSENWTLVSGFFSNSFFSLFGSSILWVLLTKAAALPSTVFVCGFSFIGLLKGDVMVFS